MSLNHILAGAKSGATAVKSIAKSVGAFTKNNASNILTGVGVALVIAGAVKGVLGGEKVKEDIQSAEIKNARELTKKEKLTIAGKRLWPAAVMTVGGATCFVCAHIIDVRECIRTAAELETLRRGYNEIKGECADLTEKYFDLNESVNETLSPEDSAKVRNKFVDKQMEGTPRLPENTVSVGGDSEEVFVGSITGQYFQGSENIFYAALSKLCIRAMRELSLPYITVNDVLEEFGANQAGEWADIWGWDLADGSLEIKEFVPHRIDTSHWIAEIVYCRPPKRLYQTYD